ncbi:MAG: sulfurtransferase TusA family protein [Propionibacteriales bacterium]|nr:sulfurtransferase TusA family protein [Propionibacteriales bacterium]
MATGRPARRHRQTGLRPTGATTGRIRGVNHPPDITSHQGDGPHLVHGGDLSCARLLILLRNVVQALEPGTLVHLVTTDPVAPIDLPAWCRMTGHTYLGKVPGHSQRPRYAIRVVGTARATLPHAPWRMVETPPRPQDTP